MHGPYLKRSQTNVYNFGTVREQPAVDGRSVATVTNVLSMNKQGAVRASTMGNTVRILHYRRESSPLRLLTMHSRSRTHTKSRRESGHVTLAYLATEFLWAIIDHK